MYKIIGSDQKEYGPITAEQLQQWLAQGRVNGQTMVQAEGGPWKPLSAYPEFAAALGSASASVPPLQSPSTMGSPGARESALQQVSGPAIGLIITAILGLMSAIAGLLMKVLGFGFGAAGMGGGSPEAERLIRMFSGTLGLVSNFIGLLVSVFLLYGGLKMKKGENYTLGMVASILAMIPCISPCCFLGLPIGIWALVVLNRPEVKSHFR